MLENIDFKGETIQAKSEAVDAIRNKQWDRQTVIYKNGLGVWTGSFRDCIPKFVAFCEADGIDMMDGPGPYSWAFAE